MKLFTKDIEKKLQAQYKQGSDEDQLIVCKIFNPYGAGTWWLINQDPNDSEYLWCIAHIFETEEGSVGKSELENYRTKFGCGLERDLYFNPITIKEFYQNLKKENQ